MKWIIDLVVGSVLGPLFNYLNKRIDERVALRQSDNATAGAVAGATLAAQTNADNANAQIRMKEGAWSPWTVTTIVGFLFPFGWHTWQVCLDSSKWVPTVEFLWGFIPYPSVTVHVVGSWKVAALPGLFETTEHAVIQSLFIGAGVAVGGIAVVKAIRGK